MDNYYVASHVFVRVLDNRAFLLDIRRDEYFCVPNSDELAKRVMGWPAAPSLSSTEGTCAEASETLADLIGIGVLTRREQRGESMTVPPARSDWFDEWRHITGSMAVPYIIPFAVAFLETALTWWLPLERRVGALRRRVARRAKQGGQEDARSVQRLTGIFLLLRAWAYTAHERCLFDSFVMANFLSRCGSYPHLVMGIQARPFSAHCWIQYEDCALNELDTRTRRYAPILVI